MDEQYIDIDVLLKESNKDLQNDYQLQYLNGIYKLVKVAIKEERKSVVLTNFTLFDFDCELISFIIKEDELKKSYLPLVGIKYKIDGSPQFTIAIVLLEHNEDKCDITGNLCFVVFDKLNEMKILQECLVYPSSGNIIDVLIELSESEIVDDIILKYI